MTNLTIKDITVLTGYSKAAITNWRKRYPSFPAPVLSATSRPLRFDKEEVIAWLKATFPDRPPAQQADDLATHLNALRAATPDRYSTTLRALQLLTFSTLARPQSTHNDETLTWDILQHGASPDYAIRQALNAQTGPLSPAEATLYNHFTERAPDTPAAEVAETIMTTLLRGFSAAESVPHGMVCARSSRLLAVAAATAMPPSACVYDPVCGIGDSLIHLTSGTSDFDIYASDISSTATAITTLRLHLHGCTPTVNTQDLLAADPHAELKADVAIAEAPYSAPRETLTRSNRWPAAWKPTGPHAADAAFLLDAIAHLTADGYGYVITSANMLTARDLRQLRTHLVANGNVEAVIELPPAVAPTSLPTALWVLRARGADTTVLINATEDTMIETNLPAWLTAIRTSTPLTTEHATITAAQMTTQSSHLRAGPHLHPAPTSEEASVRWHTAGDELEETLRDLRHATSEDSEETYMGPSGELITRVDVDARPDFTKAPVVTIKRLLQERILRTVKCSGRPKEAPQPEWTREVFVLPVHELGALTDAFSPEDSPGVRAMARMTGSNESPLMRVPDDYDAAKTGDIIIPVAGKHEAIAAPFDGIAITSASRALRVEDEAVLNRDYLLHCINADWNSATSTSAGVHRRTMEDILVPLIPLDDQKAFVKYLNTLDTFERYAETAIERSRALRSATLAAIRFGATD